MRYNAKLGLVLFTIYLVFYVGFVGMSAFAGETMAATPFAGVNLAILYGAALIVGAFLLAIVYGVCCRDQPEGEATEHAA